MNACPQYLQESGPDRSNRKRALAVLDVLVYFDLQVRLPTGPGTRLQPHRPLHPRQGQRTASWVQRAGQ